MDTIVLQFEIPVETVYYTVAFARKHGIRCIVNPAPAQAVDMAGLKDLDYFVPNETEAETITGSPVKNADEPVDTGPHPDFLGRSPAKHPYKDALVELDDICGRLIDALVRTGQLESTLVVISSDNGPEMETWPDSAFTPFRCAKVCPKRMSPPKNFSIGRAN